jgi:hypothetical protein
VTRLRGRVGSGRYPVRHFTPKEWKELSDDAVWRVLAATAEDNLICCTSTPGHDSLTESGDTAGAGLVPGHAYSLLDAREALGHRLVKIRNPWGKFEWDGDWGDNSRLWTDSAKQAFNYRPDDQDGAFYMCLRDFRRSFEDFSVCYKHDSETRKWKDLSVATEYGCCGRRGW